jgi:prepilin-type processing-associated H-X9-DG protein
VDGQHAGSYGNGRNGTVVRRPNGDSKRSSLVSLNAGSIPDGASSTLLLGEKRMRSDQVGQNQPDDDQGFTSGYDWDNIRWGYNPPSPDRKGASEWTPDRFGSAHLAGINAAFCDGSVHFITFDIDSLTTPNPENGLPPNKPLGVWQKLCSRSDRQPVDLSDL